MSQHKSEALEVQGDWSGDLGELIAKNAELLFKVDQVMLEDALLDKVDSIDMMARVDPVGSGAVSGFACCRSRARRCCCRRSTTWRSAR